jgi:arylsulfatase A-like enzyme
MVYDFKQKLKQASFIAAVMFHVLLLSLVLLFTTCNNAKEETDQLTTSQPNVLFIAIDDLNDWLGCMNGHTDARTPHIDELANEGVLFLDAHCQAPLCGPSRASLMTGLRPSTTGIYGMIDDNKIREDNESTENISYLPGYLKQNGYYTMGIGKLFHHHAPDGLFDESGGRVPGFGPTPDERFVWDGYGTADKENYGRTSTDWGVFPESDSLMPDHQSASWVIERLQRDYEQPFFLAVGFLRPHVPWYVPRKWFDLYSPKNLEMPPYKSDDLNDVPQVALKMNDLPMMPSTDWAIENNEWANIVQAYLACVSFVDHQVGRIINALKTSKYADNTVIVLWSDHGYRLGEKGTFAKHCLWEEATNAPLIIAGTNVPQEKVIDVPVEMLSIYPTLLELCGLPAYEQNEGISLVPLMNGESTGVKDFSAITTFGWNNHSVKTAQYRYIRYEDGGEELYELGTDPFEWYNLANDPNYKKIKKRLKEHLPKVNVHWAKHSHYNFQPYFVNQKQRLTGQ